MNTTISPERKKIRLILGVLFGILLTAMIGVSLFTLYLFLTQQPIPLQITSGTRGHGGLDTMVNPSDESKYLLALLQPFFIVVIMIIFFFFMKKIFQKMDQNELKKEE